MNSIYVFLDQGIRKPRNDIFKLAYKNRKGEKKKLNFTLVTRMEEEKIKII